MTRFLASLALAASLPLSTLATPALAAPAPAPAPAATQPVRQTFATFFAAFRKAVLAGDRAKVADMTHLPFRDFAGGDVDRTSRTRGQFLAQYDRIFTPGVIAAIRAGKVRAFRPGIDDGDIPGPIDKGEYLLDAPDFTDQLVFVPVAGSFRLDRVPFYS